MTIGILETGRPPAALRAQWGTYDDMIRTMLGRNREYRSYDVQTGELPADPTECSAYVITGSPAGVYDDLPWIPSFLDFLRMVRGQAKLVGICFGHQAMAKAFGGDVVKSPKGWAVGMHRYEIVEPPPGMREPLAFAIPAFHQDQVVTLPPGSRVLAASEFTPFRLDRLRRHGVGAGPPRVQPCLLRSLNRGAARRLRPARGPGTAVLITAGGWRPGGRLAAALH